MNSKTVTGLVWFMVGLGLGIAGTSVYLSKKYEQIINEEFESTKETAVSVEEYPDEDATEQVNTSDDKVVVTDMHKYRTVARQYGTAKDENPRKRETKPYVISIEQFSEEEDRFDKLTIYYYHNDDTLCDESEEIIVDRDEVVGPDAMRVLLVPNVVVYVRNEKLEIDYEIISLNKSYSETVLGNIPQ